MGESVNDDFWPERAVPYDDAAGFAWFLWVHGDSAPEDLPA